MSAAADSAFTRSPAEVVAEVAERLRACVTRYEKCHDERAIFAYAYFLVTLRLAYSLSNPDIAFDSPMWVARLAAAFSEEFFNAMAGIDSCLRDEARKRSIPLLNGKVSKPWLDVYNAIRSHKSYVYEELVYSMMAHISHDLCRALLIVGREERGQSRIRDFHAMNAVLATDIPVLEKDLAKRYNPLLRILDKLAVGYDRFLGNYGIRAARAEAWYNACRLGDPLSAIEAERSISSSTGLLINSVRRPKGWFLKLLVPLFRLIIPAFHFWPEPGVRLENASFPSRPASIREARV